MKIKIAFLLTALLVLGGCGKLDSVQKQVEKNYTNDDGLIYAYPKDTDSEYLSESIGLYMDYLLLVEDEQQFSVQVETLKKHFIVQENDQSFIRWRLNENAETNALIDDIRIVSALERAADVFENEEYGELADKLSEAISTVQLQNNYTVDFYDWSLALAAQRLTLSYVDDSTAITAEASELLGNVDAAAVFFPEYYDTATNKYVASNEVHMIDQLLIALNREKRSQSSAVFSAWLKKEWTDQQKLFGRYDRETLDASVEYESLAVYYYLHSYFSLLGETEMATEVLEHAKEIATAETLANAHFFDFIHYQLLLQKQSSIPNKKGT